MADYYREALDAAARGDSKAASEALAKREAKMSSSTYTGNGGGTSMDAARAEVNRILSGSTSSGSSSGSSSSKSSSSGSSSGSSGSGSTAAANGTTTFNGITYNNTSNGGGIYSTPTSNSDVKSYTQNGVTYRTGANMQRRTDLAGKSAVSNGYTVFYDDNGYATKAVKGTTDYTPYLDSAVESGTYSSGGSQTDRDMLTEADQQRIAAIRASMKAGEITSDEANRQANAIRAGYGYSIDKGGYVTDYGALSAVNDRRESLGLSTDGTESTGQQYWRYLMGTDTSQGIPSYAEWAAQNGVSGYENSDYQNALYAAQKEASLAKLGDLYSGKTTTSTSSKTSTGTGTGASTSNYEAARNLAQAQNDIERKNFQEYAAAYGLNSGTSGQAELAQSAALQAALANINLQEAQDQEEARQAELTRLYQQAQEEQEAAAEAKQKAAEEAATASKPTLTASQAQTAAKNGLRTAEVQQAFDYYFGNGAFASLYGSGTGTGTTAAASTGSTSTAGSSKSTGKSSGKSSSGGSYNNGSLTSSQVKELQSYYGVTADGLWGKNSKAAAGGLSADAAWKAYSGSSAGSGSSAESISSYESKNGSGSFARKLANENANASDLIAKLYSMGDTDTDGNGNRWRRYQTIMSAYNSSKINSAEAAYLMDYFDALD